MKSLQQIEATFGAGGVKLAEAIIHIVAMSAQLVDHIQSSATPNPLIPASAAIASLEAETARHVMTLVSSAIPNPVLVGKFIDLCQAASEESYAEHRRVAKALLCLHEVLGIIRASRTAS